MHSPTGVWEKLYKRTHIFWFWYVAGSKDLGKIRKIIRKNKLKKRKRKNKKSEINLEYTWGIIRNTLRVVKNSITSMRLRLCDFVYDYVCEPMNLWTNEPVNLHQRLNKPRRNCIDAFWTLITFTTPQETTFTTFPLHFGCNITIDVHMAAL